MRLVRYAVGDTAAVGVLGDDDGLRATRYDDMTDFLRDGAGARDAASEALAGEAVVGATLLAPLPNPGKMLFLGRTYGRYRVDVAPEAPPFVYARVQSSIIGPGEAIRMPSPKAQVLYEGELLVVIGTPGRRIAAADAMEHVFGYGQVNDITWIDWLPHGGGEPGLPQISMSKNADTFCPMGPWLITADEFDPSAAECTVIVNGEVRTVSNTSDLVWKLPEIIEFLSNDTTLHTGDVIATGTPDAQAIAVGDEVVVEHPGLGRLVNPVVPGW